MKNTSTASSRGTTWNTRTLYRAVCEQQVIAATPDEAERIATDSVKNRSFTSEVEIISVAVATWPDTP